MSIPKIMIISADTVELKIEDIRYIIQKNNDLVTVQDENGDYAKDLFLDEYEAADYVIRALGKNIHNKT